MHVKYDTERFVYCNSSRCSKIILLLIQNSVADNKTNELLKHILKTELIPCTKQLWSRCSKSSMKFDYMTLHRLYTISIQGNWCSDSFLLLKRWHRHKAVVERNHSLHIKTAYITNLKLHTHGQFCLYRVKKCFWVQRTVWVLIYTVTVHSAVCVHRHSFGCMVQPWPPLCPRNAQFLCCMRQTACVHQPALAGALQW